MWKAIFTFLIVCFGVLAFCYYEDEFRRFVRAICRALARGIEVAADASRKLLGKIFGWLKQEKVARPCLVLVGFVALPLAIWCARADFIILVDTLPVLFPWAAAATCMAAILVGLVALCGLLAHSDGRRRQVLAVILLIGLLAVHVIVAGKREIALQKMAWEERRALDPSCPLFQIDILGLILAGTVAVVAPAGEAAGAWATLEFSGAALVYMLMGMVSSPFALIAALTHLLRKWLVDGDRLVKGEDRLFDACMAVPKTFAAVFSAEGTLLNGVAKWVAAVLQHVYDLRHERQELAVGFKARIRDDVVHQEEESLEQVHQRQLVEQRRAHEKQEFLKDLQAAGALAQRQRETITEVHNQAMQGVKQTFAAGHVAGAEEIPGAVQDLVRQRAANDCLADTVASLVLLPWRPVTHFLEATWNRRFNFDDHNGRSSDRGIQVDTTLHQDAKTIEKE